MLQRALLILSAALLTIPVHAAGIYQCSFNSGAFTTTGCYSPTAFTPTNDFLDWGAPAPNGRGISGSQYVTPASWSGANWTATTSVGGVGVGVGSAGQEYTRGDNVGYIQYGSNAGQQGSSVLQQAITGDFNAANPALSPVSLAQNPSGQYDSGATPYYGDHLFGLTNSNAGSILIAFSQPVYAVGFRISGRSDNQNQTATSVTDPAVALPIQQLTVQAYSGNTLNAAYTLQDSSGFGTCTSLLVLSGYAPCNSAPYIGIDGTSSLFGDTPATPAWITSILISSNDVLGFNIDQLQIQDASPTSVPEPATTLLMGGALALGALWNLKRKRGNAKGN